MTALKHSEEGDRPILREEATAVPLRPPHTEAHCQRQRQLEPPSSAPS